MAGIEASNEKMRPFTYHVAGSKEGRKAETKGLVDQRTQFRT